MDSEYIYRQIHTIMQEYGGSKKGNVLKVEHDLGAGLKEVYLLRATKARQYVLEVFQGSGKEPDVVFIIQAHTIATEGLPMGESSEECLAELITSIRIHCLSGTYGKG